GIKDTSRPSTAPPRTEAPPAPDETGEQAPPQPGPEGGGLLGGASAVVLALLLAGWTTGPAAPPGGRPVAAELLRAAPRPEVTTVYLLPGAQDKDPFSVLVSPAFLEQLARRPTAP